MVGKQSKSGTHAERVGRRSSAGRAVTPDQDHLTVDETLGWLQRETFAVSKEAELRIREATAIATDYARGKITPEEAGARRLRYDDRWGDALGGMYNPDKMADECILREMDRIARLLLEPASDQQNGPAKARSR